MVTKLTLFSCNAILCVTSSSHIYSQWWRLEYPCTECGFGLKQLICISTNLSRKNIYKSLMKVSDLATRPHPDDHSYPATDQTLLTASHLSVVRSSVCVLILTKSCHCQYECDHNGDPRNPESFLPVVLCLVGFQAQAALQKTCRENSVWKVHRMF